MQNHLEIPATQSVEWHISQYIRSTSDGVGARHAFQNEYYANGLQQLLEEDGVLSTQIAGEDTSAIQSLIDAAVTEYRQRGGYSQMHIPEENAATSQAFRTSPEYQALLRFIRPEATQTTTGSYLFSDTTLDTAGRYLEALQNGTKNPGAYLAQQMTRSNRTFADLSAKDLVTVLMNTRRPQLFAESQVRLDGSDWTLEEHAILAGISFMTQGTHAFNNGEHNARQVRRYTPPLPVNFVYISGALFRNTQTGLSNDLTTVINDNGMIDENKFYALYEQRLLPGLLLQNRVAHAQDKRLVINIPGVGCGQFAGQYGAQVRAALPRVLKKLFDTHGAELNRVDAVNYDPYQPMSEDTLTSTTTTGIRLMARPYLDLSSEARSCSLEYPRDGHDYSNHLLVKVVAWDPFSFPGNDIWNNSRVTDDGVSMASSDGIRALINMGQFPTCNTPVFQYGHHTATFGPGYHTHDYVGFAQRFPSTVTNDMLQMVPLRAAAVSLANSTNPDTTAAVTTGTEPDYSFLMQVLSGVAVVSGALAIIAAFAFFNAAALSIPGLVVASLGVVGLGLGAYGLFKYAPNSASSESTFSDIEISGEYNI